VIFFAGCIAVAMNLHGKIFDKKSQFHIETLDKGVNMATVVVLNLAAGKEDR